eukprot:5235395-Alexandrium_andersonii.AAC.1
MSETPIPQAQKQEASREARRLLRLAVRQGWSPTSSVRSRGEGCLARWACWDRGPLGLHFGPRARFNQTPE